MKSLNDALLGSSRKKEQISYVSKKKKKEKFPISCLVGAVIARARIESGFTQKKLGNEIGTTQSVISRIESGRGNITLKTLEAIAKILKKKLVIRFR